MTNSEPIVELDTVSRKSSYILFERARRYGIVAYVGHFRVACPKRITRPRLPIDSTTAVGQFRLFSLRSGRVSDHGIRFSATRPMRT